MFLTLFNLIGGVRGVLIIVLIAALGGWAGMQKIKLDEANATAATAIAERDEAGVARDKAVAANIADQNTIAQMQQEKADIQKALNNLAKARRTNGVLISRLSTTIKSQAGLPANQALLSPVIRDVVSQIQTARSTRMTGVPQK